MFYVYRYSCPIKKEPIYIGKGKIGKRGTPARSRFHLTNSCTNTHLKNRIAWIRDQGQEPIIEFICMDVDEELAFLVEEEAISKYGRRDLGTGTLCNWTNGGEGSSGFKHSEASRIKISQSQIGRVSTPETNLKRSLATKGRPKSEETRRKMSEAAKNRSPEHRAKISAANRKKHAT